MEVTRIVTESVVEAEESLAAEPGAPAATAPPAGLSDRAETTSASLTLEQNSRLTAGEVDDNAQWDDYLLYLRNYSGAAIIPVDVSERHQIWV